MLDYKQQQNTISATGKDIFICEKCVTVNDLVNKAHCLLRLTSHVNYSCSTSIDLQLSRQVTTDH